MKNAPQKSWLNRVLTLVLSAAIMSALALVGAAPATAAEGRYTVSGQVNALDGSGGVVPLEGAHASISFVEVGESGSRYDTVSAADGSFSFDPSQTFPAGDFTIEFYLEGYGDHSVDFTIDDEDVVLAPVTMLPSTDTSNVTVSFTGTGLLGETLTVTTTGWPAGTELSYEWFSFVPERFGGEITGATASTYVVTKDVLGHHVAVNVSGEVPGVSAKSEAVGSSNFVIASASKKPTAAAPSDLAKYLSDNGSTPEAQTSAGLPAGALDPGVAYTASVDWWGADSFVDVYVFSTPTLVGTFPVVNGVALIPLSPAVLGQLAAGNHTLVLTGQTSGSVQSITLSIGLAATGFDPTVPVTVAMFLTLIGTALLLARRRLGLKA